MLTQMAAQLKPEYHLAFPKQDLNLLGGDDEQHEKISDYLHAVADALNYPGAILHRASARRATS